PLPYTTVAQRPMSRHRMPKLVTKLYSLAYLRRIAPRWVLSALRRHVSLTEARTAAAEAAAPFKGQQAHSSYEPRYPYTLGIIKEFWHRHSPYIAACRDLKVAYRVIDISGPDWIDVIQNSGCDAFLVWPSVQLSIWKQMYDERLKVMVEEMGKTIYPTYRELWLWESKRRMHYWLEANNIPHPKTSVFYDREEALCFARRANLPVVYKSNMGSAASGVTVFRQRSALLRFVNRCFRRGVLSGARDRLDREWGNVLLQEYLPNVNEWRVLRLGESYFAHLKLRMGDFHSGSGEVAWSRPPKRLLDFVRRITEKGGFTSMNVDAFETADRHFLVNELQPMFGSYLDYQMLIEGRPGRFLFDHHKQQWTFEEGTFNHNASCNLRVQALLDLLGQ
ncbi:MAG: ATP-grasp domain-containing protein, partial [bacterium]